MSSPAQHRIIDPRPVHADLFGSARPTCEDASELPRDGLDREAVARWQKLFACRHVRSLS